MSFEILEQADNRIEPAIDVINLLFTGHEPIRLRNVKVPWD